MIGLSPLQAQHAVSSNPHEVVRHARRRKAFKGVLSIEPATLEDVRRLDENAANRQDEGQSLKRTFAELQSS